MTNMIFFSEFINQLEHLCANTNNKDYIEDRLGKHSKILVIKNFIAEARKLIEHGEYHIALENLLLNLDEVSIKLDKKAIESARMALGKRLSIENEELLKNLSL